MERPTALSSRTSSGVSGPLVVHEGAVQSIWRAAKVVGMLAMKSPRASTTTAPQTTRARTSQPPRKRVSAMLDEADLTPVSDCTSARFICVLLVSYRLDAAMKRWDQIRCLH